MAWEITTTELLERYAVGERNFAGIDLLPPPQEFSMLPEMELIWKGLF